MKTMRDAWGKYPAMMQMAKKVGVDPDTEMRVYTDVCLTGDEQEGTLDPCGLVSYQWEEGDELHLDGKVLWKTESARFYVDVYLLVNGVVEHYAMSNNCENLGYAAVDARTKEPDTGEDRPQCHRCWKGEGHGTYIDSNISETQWSVWE